MIPDCNRCITNCRGAAKLSDMIKCRKFYPPKEGESLITLVLAHPTSLNAALSALPFKVSLRDYLRKGE